MLQPTLEETHIFWIPSPTQLTQAISLSVIISMRIAGHFVMRPWRLACHWGGDRFESQLDTAS